MIHFARNKALMSQDNMIKLESEGTEEGVGKGHIIRTHKNTKKLRDRLRVKKYNPVAGTHTWYKETK